MHTMHVLLELFRDETLNLLDVSHRIFVATPHEHFLLDLGRGVIEPHNGTAIPIGLHARDQVGGRPERDGSTSGRDESIPPSGIIAEGELGQLHVHEVSTSWTTSLVSGDTGRVDQFLHHALQGCNLLLRLRHPDTLLAQKRLWRNIMGQRIYAQIATIGDSSLYSVDQDPNGATFDSPPDDGSLAIQGTGPDSPRLWQFDGTSWLVVGAFYLPEVILRPDGPVNAPNVVTTVAEARALINAGSGVRALVIEGRSPVTFDAGTYGDRDVVIIGRTQFEPNDWADSYAQAAIILEEGAVLPGLRYENLTLVLNDGVVTPPITADGETYFFKNVTFSIVNPFAPPAAPFIEVPTGSSTPTLNLETVLMLHSPTIEVDGSTVDLVGLDVFIRGGRCFLGTSFFGGASTVQSTGANAFLRAEVDEDSFLYSDQGAFEGLLPGFTDGGGFIDSYYVGQRYSAGIQAPVDTLVPGQAVSLPPLNEVPQSFRYTFVRDDRAGANATVTAAAGDTLFPTDPISIAQGEAATVMKVSGFGSGNFFWTTL